jgi:alpha-L-rhamnosidase
MGRMVCGWLRVGGKLAPNAVLTIRYAEERDGQGRLRTRTNRTALCTDRYVPGPNPDGPWQPRFSSRSFRYAEISCHGVLGNLDLAGCTVHDPVPSRADFRCSDERLNALFEACKTTFAHNLVGFLRDCPARDERLGWMGDALAAVPAVLMCLDADAVVRRWIEEIAATCDDAGQRWADMAPVDPSHQRAHGTFRWRQQLPAAVHPADNVYTAAGTLLPWYLYQRTGDVSILEDHYPSIDRHLRTWPAMSDWPLVNASRHGDHAAMRVGPEGPVTSKPLVSQGVLLREYRCAARMGGILGRAEAAWHQARADELAAAIMSAPASS